MCVQSSALAQARIELDAALHTWDGREVPDELYAFRSTAEAEEAVKCVLEAVGGLRMDNFEIAAANVGNAAAAIREDTRLLLYSPRFMQELREEVGNRWAGITVMAHEIGHHLEAHTISEKGSNPNDELEADEFAGNVLKRLGASLDDAQAVFRIFPIEGSETHPSRDARLTAVATGWTRPDAPAPNARIRDCYSATSDDDPSVTEQERREGVESDVIDFGDNTSEWAYDDVCDDNRFRGDERYYFHWDDGQYNLRDATDCRTHFEAGRIQLRAAGPETELPEIDFGGDTSRWANDGECDDNRFVGSFPYYVHWEDGEHNLRDATDCRTHFEVGRIQLRTAGPETELPEIDFGDDASEWAYDGVCDDNRFVGDSLYYFHWDDGEHNLRDATDCRTHFEASRIQLRAAGPEVDFFGDDSSEWAYDGACDDNRFVGAPPYYYHWSRGQHNLRDASDCRENYEEGHIVVRTIERPIGP